MINSEFFKIIILLTAEKSSKIYKKIRYNKNAVIYNWTYKVLKFISKFKNKIIWVGSDYFSEERKE